MHISSLFEDEKTDRILRRMAVDAFDRFSQRMKIESLNGYENMRFVEDGPFAGGLMISGAYAGLKSDGIAAVILLPQKKYEFRASLGHYRESGATVLLLACLVDNFSFKYLLSRIQGMKTDFIHEWSHHQLNDRWDKGSITGMDEIDREKYYNDPHETNAFYQEAAHRAEDLFRSMAGMDNAGVKDKVAEFSDKSTQELVTYVRDKMVNPEFVQYLNDANRRALDKRLARFVEQTLRGILSRGIPAA